MKNDLIDYIISAIGGIALFAFLFAGLWLTP
jgi:hypothetical protein